VTLNQSFKTEKFNIILKKDSINKKLNNYHGSKIVQPKDHFMVLLVD